MYDHFCEAVKLMTGLADSGWCYKEILAMGRGGCQMVTVLAFYSDRPSSNTTESTIFICEMLFEKNEIKW